MTKTLLGRLQNSWWFAWIAALVLALAQLKDAVDGLDKVLVLAKVRPDALALAQAAEKGDFSRKLTEVAWRRLFWARAFRSRLELGAARSDVDEAWKAYVSASETWSSEIMVYIVTSDRFYGAAKANELEGNVQYALNTMNDQLVALRYSQQASPTIDALKAAKSAIDEANSVLYVFARGFERKPA